MRQTELLQLAALTIPFVLFGAFLLWAILSPRMTGESMFWFSMIAGGADRDKFVNLWKADLHSQDTLFGARHLFHLFHLLLTMGPFLFILRRIARDLAARRDELQFLLASLGGLLVLAVFWNADLGMPRDMDILAFFALPVQVLLLLWMEDKIEPGRRAVLALQMAISNVVFCVLPFLQF